MPVIARAVIVGSVDGPLGLIEFPANLDPPISG
jgi:hypothetical protein